MVGTTGIKYWSGRKIWVGGGGGGSQFTIAYNNDQGPLFKGGHLTLRHQPVFLFHEYSHRNLLIVEVTEVLMNTRKLPS